MDLTDFTPREYQLPALQRLVEGATRNVWVWHRRSGKDLTAWNWTILRALTVVGGYYYFLPTYKQARKVIWDNFTNAGKSFLSFIPKEFIDGKPNETDLRIRLTNGSIIQLIAADQFDGNVGASFRGAVFSEYSVQSRLGWEFMSPIAVESGAWVIFVYTPRGHNHGYDMYINGLREVENGNKRWHVTLLTVDDTKSLDEEALAEERRLKSREMFLQEYYCRFDITNTGTIFGAQIETAHGDNRITQVPHDPSLPVFTAWDVGVADPTAVWFFQRTPTELRFIDYYERAGGGLPLHVKEVLSKSYNYAGHFFPHDMKVEEFGTGVTRLIKAEELGLRNSQTVEKWKKEEQWENGRMILGRCYFDRVKCADGLKKLAKYGVNFKEELGEYAKQPKDNENSHAADAYMYAAIAEAMGLVEEERFYGHYAANTQVIGTMSNSPYSSRPPQHEKPTIFMPKWDDMIYRS